MIGASFDYSTPTGRRRRTALARSRRAHRARWQGTVSIEGLSEAKQCAFRNAPTGRFPNFSRRSQHGTSRSQLRAARLASGGVDSIRKSRHLWPSRGTRWRTPSCPTRGARARLVAARKPPALAPGGQRARAQFPARRGRRAATGSAPRRGRSLQAWNAEPQPLSLGALTATRCASYASKATDGGVASRESC